MRASLPPAPNRVRRLIFIALLSLGLLAACGLKDDLYLPPPEPPAQESDAEPEPSNAARS
ncbi:MAG: LPS translocon maturation chaperone LptM [Wenzhouxiangella sp.]